MNPLFDHLAVVAIVAGAVAFFVVRFIRQRSKGKGCGSDCGCGTVAREKTPK